MPNTNREGKNSRDTVDWFYVFCVWGIIQPFIFLVLYALFRK